MTRPDITEVKSGSELKKWYWLKEELVHYCKSKNINYVGAKFEILERISFYLDNGKMQNASLKTKNKSTFNWSKAILSLNTIITDSYTNGPNSRKFFKQHCGESFRFTIPFMNFMKNNCGKTLSDAVTEWNRLNRLEKSKDFKSEIPASNQYNKYIRDFFADNPKKTIEQARHFWKLKKTLPVGRHFYEKSDLSLK